MAVEVGELEVVSPPAEPAAAAPGRPGGDAAPGPSGVLPSELVRGLALEHSRDLRLRAD
jgi:hypothetical protein